MSSISNYIHARSPGIKSDIRKSIALFTRQPINHNLVLFSTLDFLATITDTLSHTVTLRLLINIKLNGCMTYNCGKERSNHDVTYQGFAQRI